jgi:hypothetical protein
MRIQLLVFLLICCLFSCRRKDTYPDYKGIKGKYKLVYIERWNTTWPSDSIVRFFPSDKYEIDFKTLSKVMGSKNEHCEQTLKVYSCKEEIYNSSPQSHSFRMDIDHKSYEWGFYFNTATNNFTDTLFTNTVFYPFTLAQLSDGDGCTYVYLKE